MLTVECLTSGYGEKTVLHDVSFTVEKGEVFGIVGPNGSGKTTLLKVVGGLLPVQCGAIYLHGRPLTSYKSKELARLMAALPQTVEPSFAYTVREIVALGRYPYQRGMFAPWTRADEAVVRQAMLQTNVQQFAHSPLQFLSGGERQRVFLARALAQEPQLLLLDEPTNHLDLSHQTELFDALRQWVKEEQLTVVLISHSLDLASLYCDRLLLLDRGAVTALGTPAAVLEEERLARVYRTILKRQDHPDVPRPTITLLPRAHRDYKREASLDDLRVTKSERLLKIESPAPLKRLSSAAVGGGSGWSHTFVTCCVPSADRVAVGAEDGHQPAGELVGYLQRLGINAPERETVATVTAADAVEVASACHEEDGLALRVVASAGFSEVGGVPERGDNSDVVALSDRQTAGVGTVHIFVFVAGELTEVAFVQALMTANEAKVRALAACVGSGPRLASVTNVSAAPSEEEGSWMRKVSVAGTASDSIVVAATQNGSPYTRVDAATSVGQALARAVYRATVDVVAQCR
ncbi:ABC transporter ATP-binding protein [Numidum massiliense]|uniref:ABC transporter ATP-binding protein n=1 Tax=Numidum massiliense TaxID=1522315 RepID=UPI0006D5B4DD|nr:ATP-binding cassette domain-containing protein [Numidum massiliense]